MKRTLTGIAAAAVVLGTLAPAAFAATPTSLSHGGGKTISLDGTTLYSGVQVGNATEAGVVNAYFPIYYLQQALNQAGYTNTYDPGTHVWNLQIPGVDGSKVAVDGGVGSGNSAIAINGFVVKRFNAVWNKDLAGGPNAVTTTYFPLFYLTNTLKAAGFSSAWDGNNFGFQSNFGAASAVKLSAASSSVVANNTSTDTVTLNVTDANGHVVRNFSGYVNVDFSANNGAVDFLDGTTPVSSLTGVKVTNGVATFQVQGLTSANVTNTVEVTGLYNTYSDATGLTNAIDTSAWNLGTLDITAAAQVATSIKVTPDSKFLANNNGGEQVGVSAEVDDQTGNPMLTGTYPISFSVSGPATFDGVSATTYASAGYGDGSYFNDAAATLYSKKGVNGTVTVTATSGSLTGTGSVTAQSAQAPAKLVVTAPSTNPNVDTASGQGTFTVTLEDMNGVAVAAPANTPITVTLSDTNLVAPTNVVIAKDASSTTFNVTSTTAENITVTAAASGLTSGNVTTPWSAGTINNLSVKPSTSTPLAVPTTNPSTSVTAQLVDDHSNPIKQAGVEVDFYIPSAPTHSITLNGTTITSSNYGTAVVKAFTDANGIATVNATAQPYAGDDWTIDAKVPVQSGVASAIGPVAGQFNVVNQVTSSLTAASVDGVNTTSFKSGDAVTFTFTAKDKNGYVVAGDKILVTPDSGANFTKDTSDITTTDNGNGTFTAVTNGSGVATVTFDTVTAGSFKVAASDLTSGAPRANPSRLLLA